MITMNSSIHDFGTSFIENKASGFILVWPNYDPLNVSAWSIALRKYDDQNFVFIVFASKDDAESELKVFPSNVGMRIESIQHLNLLKYIKLMKESTGWPVLAFARNADGKFLKINGSKL